MLTELKQYTAHSAQTASPGQLVVMLYDGFQKFAGQAQAALQGNDVATAANRLTRAQDIVGELRASLDPAQGQIADNLAQIYMFVDGRLTTARIERNAAPIDEAMRLMADLRGAWAQIANTPRPQLERSGPAVGVDLAG